MAEFGLVNALGGRQAYFEVSLDELAALELDLVLLPDEPYPFKEREAGLLAQAGVARGISSMLLMNGKHLTWYGAHSPRALRELALLLGGDGGPAP
jgi:hypothetical protein